MNESEIDDNLTKMMLNPHLKGNSHSAGYKKTKYYRMIQGATTRASLNNASQLPSIVKRDLLPIKPGS